MNAQVTIPTLLLAAAGIALLTGRSGGDSAQLSTEAAAVGLLAGHQPVVDLAWERAYDSPETLFIAAPDQESKDQASELIQGLEASSALSREFASPATTDLTSWEDVAGEAYETAVGEGFRRNVFFTQFGGLDEDFLYRLDYASPGINPNGKELTELDVDALDALADSFSPEIVHRSELAADAVQDELDARWVQGLYTKERIKIWGPDSVEGMAKDVAEEAAPNGYGYVDSFTTKGWLVRIAVHSSDSRAFGAAMGELATVRASANEAIIDYIAAL